jgi:hypothetical protein
LLHNLLDYTIQLTTYLLPRGLLSDALRPVWIKHPTNHEHCIRALGCDPSDQYTTLSHTNWLIGFVWKSAPPVTFHAPWFPCGPVDTHSFPYISFAVTSTGLISERCVATVSRLVYMNHCWRYYVGFVPLGESPLLFFVTLGEPYATGQ